SGGSSEIQRVFILSLISGPALCFTSTSGYSSSKSLITSFHHSSPYPPTKYCISISPDMSSSPFPLSPASFVLLSLLEHPAKTPVINKAAIMGINHLLLNELTTSTPFLIL